MAKIKEIDSTTIEKLENKIRLYYRYKKDIEALERRINILDRAIDSIEEDIRTANIKIDYYQNGSAITERVQTSCRGTSYVESELERAISDLEKSQAEKIKKKYKLKQQIREKEMYILNMDISMDDLTAEEREFTKLKYKDGIEIPTIAIRLHIGTTTAYNRRNSILEKMFLNNKCNKNEILVK